MNESSQTLRGSFSAVWTATIATKYYFFHTFRDLQDDQKRISDFFLQFFNAFARFFSSKIRKILSIFVEIYPFRSDFDENFSEFHEISRIHKSL